MQSQLYCRGKCYKCTQNQPTTGHKEWPVFYITHTCFVKSHGVYYRWMAMGDCVPSDWQRSVWGFKGFLNNTCHWRHATPLAHADRMNISRVLLDYFKVSDIVDHNILGKKLYNYDVPDILVHWIGSFLSHRRQHVQIFDKKYNWLHVNESVPHGSCQAPLSFFIMINDALG